MNHSSQMQKPLSGDEIGIIRREKRMGYVFALTHLSKKNESVNVLLLTKSQ